MEIKDTRWKQRFKNFEKAYNVLKRTITIKNPSEAERGGIIQYYETTFELSWKLMKDYLEELGFQPKSPRESIKTALTAEIITDGYTWIDALDDRNLNAHVYDELIALKVIASIKNNYFPAITNFYKYIKDKT